MYCVYAYHKNISEVCMDVGYSRGMRSWKQKSMQSSISTRSELHKVRCAVVSFPGDWSTGYVGIIA